MEIKRTKNSDRALLVYLASDARRGDDDIKPIIETALNAENIAAVEFGGAMETETAPGILIEPRLRYDGRFRSLAIASKAPAAVWAGVYFYAAPQPPATVEDSDDEPQPLNIPALVCDALDAAFSDAKTCATALVLAENQTAFEFEINKVK